MVLMTREEFRHIESGQIVLFKRFNEECEVLERIGDECDDGSELLIQWGELILLINECNLDQFDVVSVPVYTIPIEVTSLVYYECNARSTEDALAQTREFLEGIKDSALLQMGFITNNEILYNEIESEERD